MNVSAEDGRIGKNRLEKSDEAEIFNEKNYLVWNLSRRQTANLGAKIQTRDQYTKEGWI